MQFASLAIIPFLVYPKEKSSDNRRAGHVQAIIVPLERLTKAVGPKESISAGGTRETHSIKSNRFKTKSWQKTEEYNKKLGEPLLLFKMAVGFLEK